MAVERKSQVNLPKPPAGGWGSVEGIVHIYGESWATPAALETLARLNKPGGSMCTSCAWPKPVNYHPFEFCENGAKAILWDTTSARCTPRFWKSHTVTELRSWSDHQLEKTGRLTAPLRYDREQDRYVEVSWDEAYSAIGQTLHRLPREQVVFYASGHAGLEASYLYALLARVYGNNNLPQSSNMCHETTSVGLKRVIGSPVGTVIWEDLAEADCFFFFGQNPGVNSPRFLHPLKDAKKRGAKVITFNPVREQGLVAFVDPSSVSDMLSGHETQISDQYHQLRAGSDIAALTGLCKAVLEADETQGGTVIDHAFLAEHTHGFEDFFDFLRATSWATICAETGLSEDALRAAAAVYMAAERVIGVYGMGLTQQVHGSTNVGMLVNFLLLRGNIGRPGAGCCPVRGHSNVQGQRTVGIAEKAALVPMDKLRALFDFEPPQKDGMHIVEVGEALLRGEVAATISLGGNLLRAMPDIARLQEVWPQQQLTVTVSTKLNRSHLYPGKASYILPCLSRVEIDEQATGNQTVTIEDSFSMIHPSIGHREPASPQLRSELAIVAGIAKATLDPNPKLCWDDWQADYGQVRDLIAATYPEDFHDFNARIQKPGGFWRVNAARERVWKTPSGKAEFTLPERLNALDFADAPGRYRLITLRSNDQFNTTVYGYSDRFRGIEGTRDVLLMNAADIADAGLRPGQKVSLLGDAADEVERRVDGLELVSFEIPRGTVAGYYPELNPLIPISEHDKLSKTPASKGIAVRLAC
ncbi:FdhF/YdeP family oxidoreductase [Acidithiobacillus sp. VAN18-1]|uniref:FdhF/YdeP family oxidoreductase n=1 Tax=Igneacidithiobacillus copahuensis TaxID=2724909 RepID=A0AAE2YQ70_9PROT|nr:FdhF/YdeP family oxidoreductase [Igneacidithiobacillus copahuensis]MBU2787965.1 FdhF/YdeP family oxidoreductase [Igneacidithiobacillus copahuensis]MBU2796560.1 FdhF/YdeP family oxidoreductase [Acidithiobacillus sp. VAN18-2]